jgi:hypothetical protein
MNGMSDDDVLMEGNSVDDYKKLCVLLSFVLPWRLTPVSDTGSPCILALDRKGLNKIRFALQPQTSKSEEKMKIVKN